MTPPAMIWIQTNHIADNVALDKWDVRPSKSDPDIFTAYIKADMTQLVDLIGAARLLSKMNTKHRRLALEYALRAFDDITMGETE